MKNGALIVFKKELARFFGDKRLLFTSVIMPGLLIYVIYSLMGSSMSTMLKDKTSSFTAAAVDMPQSISKTLAEMDFEIEDIELAQLDDSKEKVKDGELSLCVVFPQDFEEALASYTAGIDNVQNVEIWYNSADIGSSQAYSRVVAALDGVERSVSNVFDINGGKDADYDLATDEDTTGTIFAMILPMLLMTLMYSSCVALAPESIAGEKERGTIAALLITPVPRSQIILGKVCALSVMALLGGLSSFLGTFLSLPALMASMGDETEIISTQVYKAADFLWLILLILSTVLLFITLISIVSTLAKSVKEAGTMVMPLMLVVMLMSFSTMYQSEPRVEFFWFFIPLYNTIQGMSGIFSFSSVPINLLITAASNVAYSLVGIFVLTKLFDNERVMFNA